MKRGACRGGTLCSECRGPLRSKAAKDSGLCGTCFRRLGAVPTRLPGGKHDPERCLCFGCVDRRREYEQDAEWDRGAGEAVEE